MKNDATARATGLGAIDRASHIPYYYQLLEILRRGIDEQVWPPGALLPSEANMTKMFGVSRTAIRQALDVLEGEGLAYRIKGKGTIVAQPMFEYEAIQWPLELHSGKHVSAPSVCKVIDTRVGSAGGRVGKVLGVTPETEVFVFTVVEAIVGTPSALLQMFVRVDASVELAELYARAELPVIKEGGDELLVQVCEQYGVPIVESRVTLDLAKAARFEARAIGLKVGTPMLVLNSVELSEDNYVQALTRTVVRSDQFPFSFRVSRDG